MDSHSVRTLHSSRHGFARIARSRASNSDCCSRLCACWACHQHALCDHGRLAGGRLLRCRRASRLPAPFRPASEPRGPTRTVSSRLSSCPWRRSAPRARRAEWRFNPSWVRLERQEHEEFGTQRLDLVSRGERVEMAGFLGPAAKADLADRLTRALAQARRGFRIPDACRVALGTSHTHRTDSLF